MQITEKQKNIIDALIKANPDGSWLDLDQLLNSLPYRTTKESLQFSIRVLIEKGLIEKVGRESRRRQQRIILAPTALSYNVRNV